MTPPPPYSPRGGVTKHVLGIIAIVIWLFCSSISSPRVESAGLPAGGAVRKGLALRFWSQKVRVQSLHSLIVLDGIRPADFGTNEPFADAMRGVSGTVPGCTGTRATITLRVSPLSVATVSWLEIPRGVAIAPILWSASLTMSDLWSASARSPPWRFWEDVHLTNAASPLATCSGPLLHMARNPCFWHVSQQRPMSD